MFSMSLKGVFCVTAIIFVEALGLDDISLILNNSDFEDDDSSNEDPADYYEPDHYRSNLESSSSEDEDEDSDQHHVQEERSCPLNNVEQRNLQPPGGWLRSNFLQPLPGLCQPSYFPDHLGCSDILEYLHEYLDDTIFELIVEKTNQTAVHRQGKSLNITKAECKTFFGITIVMSCLNYPHIRMYWSQKWTLNLISNAMTRDRYFQLRQSLKLVFDNDINEEMKAADKLWKVRPIITRVLEGCHKQVRDQKMSIGEMIIPFTGACPIRQYCPGKTNPTGIKAFVLANTNGLVCDLEVYQGKKRMSTTGNTLAEDVVKSLARTLVPGHILFFDQYFTTFPLVRELHNRGFKCVGTVMKNRIPNDIKLELESDINLAVEGRGSHDVLVSSDGEIAITKWFDKKPMMFLSSQYAAESVDLCRRYDRKNRQYVHVSRPEVVKEYNANVGGVNLTDRLLAVCPSRQRTNKWTVRFIFHFVDLAITNAWIKYKKEMQLNEMNKYKILKLRDFKRIIGEHYIENSLINFGTPGTNVEETEVNSTRGRPALVPIPSKVRRLHGTDHLPDKGTVQHRCRNKGCVKKTCVLCLGCNLYLCLTPNRNCFKQFHTDVNF